ncbi:MAG: hypothetical protein ACRDAM_19670, partial [Casimicrobium sp.]
MLTQIKSKGIFPLEVLQMMGLSAKTNSNPIGQFGTGAKYAIAILLRTGHGVSLQRSCDKEPILFTLESEVFRDQSYQSIYMHTRDAKIKLPFTSDYGKSWDVKMAFREMWSNMLDEEENETEEWSAWKVVGQAFADAYALRDEMFLSSRGVIYKSEAGPANIEVINAPSRHVYVKGVAAFESEKTFARTYNCNDLKLSEDRQIDSYDFYYRLPCRVLLYLEQTLDFEIFNLVSAERDLHWIAV